MTDLWASAASDDAESLSFLLGPKGGCGVNDTDDQFRTPLHVAASSGSERATRLLIQSGANLDKPDGESHWTAMHRALYNGHVRTALLLFRAGATLGDELPTSRHPTPALDKDGHTPLSLLSWELRQHLSQRPKRIEALAHTQVVSLAANRYHSVGVTREGEVFSWGHGKAGRLGHGDEAGRPFPELVRGLAGVRIARASCGENHTMLLSCDGAVFTCGSDRFGQLGLGGAGDKGARLVPQRVEALRRVAVRDASAGQYHSCVVGDDGYVWAWGSNKLGQLGLEGVAEVRAPKQVTILHSGGKEPRRAIGVAAGARSTLVLVAPPATLLQEGRAAVNAVYAFGHGSHLPVRVPFHRMAAAQVTKGWGSGRVGGQVNVVQMAVGLHHNVALSSTGAVFVWGLGEAAGGGSSSWSMPREVDGLPGPAIDISVSSDHTCVVTDSGDLLTFGSTVQKGVMGVGPINWTPVPKRVSGLKRVMQVACGGEHTLCVVAPSVPPLPHTEVANVAVSRPVSPHEDEHFSMADLVAAPLSPRVFQPQTLKQTCERVMASHVDMRNAISIASHAEALDAAALCDFTSQFIMRNLDGVLTYTRPRDLDFLLEDDGEDLTTLLQLSGRAQQQQQQGEGRRSRLSVLLERMGKGREPTLEETLNLERSLKKKLGQIADLERLDSTLTLEQLAKVARRPVIEQELASLLPLIGRARIVEAAKAMRGGGAAPMVAEEEGGALSEAQVEGPMGGEVLAKEKGEVAERVSWFCDACNLTCKSQATWEDHLGGRRHQKRLAARAAAAEEEQRAATERLRQEALAAEEANKPPRSLPWAQARPDTATTPAPKSKSLREILQEEERVSASASARQAKSGGSAEASRERKRTPWVDDSPPTPLTWLTRGGSASPEKGGSALLSGFVEKALSSGTPSTPAKASEPSSSASRWSGWGTPATPTSASPAAAVMERSRASPVFRPRSLDDIMAEEAQKAGLNDRFSGNNCPWFVERRDRSASFEVIQSEQLVQAEIAAEVARIEAQHKLEEERRQKEQKERRARSRKQQPKKAASAHPPVEGEAKEHRRSRPARKGKAQAPQPTAQGV